MCAIHVCTFQAGPSAFAEGFVPFAERGRASNVSLFNFVFMRMGASETPNLNVLI